jgi:hypothetical protein
MKVPNLEMKNQQLNARVFSEIVTTKAEDKILANHDVAAETTEAPEKAETAEITETLAITVITDPVTIATEIIEIETTESLAITATTAPATLVTEIIEIETTATLVTEIIEIETTETLATEITEIETTETLATEITEIETTETLVTEIIEIETTETPAITATTAPAITARGDEVPDEMVAVTKAETVDLPANDRATEIGIIKDVVLAGEEEALPTFRIF